MITTKNLVFFLFLCFCINIAQSQITYDSTFTNGRKNIIRYNPTPGAIVGLESFVFGYERVFKPHQSFSVNVGRLKFRQFVDLNLDRFGINSTRKSGGYTIAMDYRRYFKKRNRGYAPDGLYWGPFYNYYWYKNEIGISYKDPAAVTSSEVNLETELRVYHIGVQLGYQFIIKKRLAIDLVLMGPSWGKYRADFQLNGKLEVDEENELIQDFYDIIKDRIPGISTLVQERSLGTSGHFSTNTFGMRYLVQIGYLF